MVLDDGDINKTLLFIPVERNEEPESNFRFFTGFHVKHGMTSYLFLKATALVVVVYCIKNFLSSSTE